LRRPFDKHIDSHELDALVPSSTETGQELHGLSPDAVRKADRSTPAARQKGRLQEGADADIVVFDGGTIGDRSTFEKPMEKVWACAI